MKKLLLLLLLCSTLGWGQSTFKVSCTANGCSPAGPAANSSQTLNLLGSPSNTIILNWQVTGTVSGGTFTADSSIDPNAPFSPTATWTTGGMVVSTSLTINGSATVTGPFSFGRIVTSGFTGTGTVLFTMSVPGLSSVAGAVSGSAPQGQPLVGGPGNKVSGSQLFIDTSQFPGTDRCAIMHSFWPTVAVSPGAEIDSRGEVANETATQLTCNSNPFPVTATYGGTDIESGGKFDLPVGAIYTTVPLNLGANNVEIKGVVPGSLLGSNAKGSNIIVQPSFATPNGTGFNPFVFAIGGIVGVASSLVGGTGPYNSHVRDVTFDSQAAAGIGGVSICSGQDHSGFTGINVRNARTVSIEFGCGTPFNSDFEIIEHGFVTHPLAGAVELNTTPANVSAWSCGITGLCIITWNNSPSATPGYGHELVISGTATGTNSTVINGTYEACAIPGAALVTNGWCPAVFASANQVAFMRQSLTADSSATVQGTTTFNTVGMRIAGSPGQITARMVMDDSQSSLISAWPGRAPLCQYIISSKSVAFFSAHAEVANTGFCIGTDGVTDDITFVNVTPSSDLTNGFHIFNQWGEPTNIHIIGSFSSHSLNVTNWIVDDGNSCTLTTLNNHAANYDIDGAGKAFTNANPVDIAGTGCTIWDFYNGVLTHYTAGVADTIVQAGSMTAQSAGCVSNGASFCYDTTAKNFHIPTNAGDALALATGAVPTSNRLLKATGGGTINSAGASLATDNGTNITYTGTGGIVASAGPLSGGVAAGVPGLIDLTGGYTTSPMAQQTSASCTNVTNMTWNVAANKRYHMHCTVPITFAASATVQFCIGGPGTPTSHTINAIGSIGAAGVYDDIFLINSATYGTKTNASGAVGASSQNILVDADIQNGATASGTALTLQTAANGTNGITVLADAYCRLEQLN